MINVGSSGFCSIFGTKSSGGCSHQSTLPAARSSAASQGSGMYRQVHHLTARRPARRLIARDVVGITHVHDLLAGLPLVPRELEGPGTDDFLDLIFRRRRRDPRRHHERSTRISQSFEHRAEVLREFERERVLVDGRDVPRMSHEKLAEAIVLSPALERLYTVFRYDRL